MEYFDQAGKSAFLYDILRRVLVTYYEVYNYTFYLHEILRLVGDRFGVDVEFAIFHRRSRPVSIGHMTKLQPDKEDTIVKACNSFLDKAQPKSSI